MHKIIHGTDTTTLSFSYEATTSQPTSRILATSVAHKRIAPNPKPQKTPKSSYPQKQHNIAIKFLLFVRPHP